MESYGLSVALMTLLLGCGSASSPSKPATSDLSTGATDGSPSPSGTDMAAAGSDLASPTGSDLAAPSGSDLATAADLAHQPSFQNDVFPILTNSGCLSHHMTTAWNGVEGVSGGAAIIAYLTSTASSQCASDKFVAAGDATNSYLYQKVSGNFASPCATSDTMPFGAGPLPVAQSDTIKAWINAGAHNN
jgi:hypothetical protein